MGKRLLQSAFVALLLSSIGNAQGASSDLPARLAEADRLAWLTNWYDALPIYSEVEQAATKAGNRRDAMYAKFGRLRGQMQVLPLPDISEQIAADLATPLAKQDRRLRLRGLTVKGDIDLEWDVLAAERDWREVRQLARDLATRVGRIAPTANWAWSPSSRATRARRPGSCNRRTKRRRSPAISADSSGTWGRSPRGCGSPDTLPRSGLRRQSPEVR